MAAQFYAIVADVVLIIHFCFVLFVVTGGLLALRKKFWMFYHIPAVVWGVFVEWGSFTCPLTNIENYFVELSGELPQNSSFVGRILAPILYPEDYTENVQLALGSAIVLINLIVYVFVFTKEGNRI